jgi:hypothetical protein
MRVSNERTRAVVFPETGGTHYIEDEYIVVCKFSAHLIGYHFVGVQDVAYNLNLFGPAGLGFDDSADGVEDSLHLALFS